MSVFMDTQRKMAMGFAEVVSEVSYHRRLKNAVENMRWLESPNCAMWVDVKAKETLKEDVSKFNLEDVEAITMCVKSSRGDRSRPCGNSGTQILFATSDETPSSRPRNVFTCSNCHRRRKEVRYRFSVPRSRNRGCWISNGQTTGKGGREEE
jgi:hypothetical protein